MVIDSECEDLVKRSWVVTGATTDGYPVQNKLNNCLKVLKEWHLKNYGRLNMEIDQAVKRLVISQSNCDGSPSFQHLDDLQNQVDGLLEKQEMYWRQCSKALWLEAGDRNTKFFHKKASNRRKANFFVWK